MKNSKEKIIQLLKNNKCENIKFISEPISPFGVKYYCISYTDEFNDIKIVYIRNLKEDILVDRVSGYTIREFVYLHHTRQFLEFLLDDFQTNPVFNTMKLL